MGMLVFVCLKRRFYMGLNIFIGIIGAIALAAGVWCFCVDKGYFHNKKDINNIDTYEENENEKN